MLLIQLLKAEAAEIVTIQPDSIKLQKTNAQKNTNPDRPFVYCLDSLQTLFPMASPNEISLITAEWRQPQLTPHSAPV